MNAPPLGEIVGVYLKVGELEAETGEARDADHVALLVPDGRAHHGDLVAFTGVVTELVQDVRNHDSLGRAGVEHEIEARTFAERSPDAARDDNQVINRIEARDLHGTTNRGIGPRIRPVKKQPTFSKLRHAVPMSFVASRRPLR